MTKARDIATLLSTANGKIAGENLDVSFENITDTGTEGTRVATGTTAQRGTTAGQLRFNTDTGLTEYYNGSSFKGIDTPPNVSSINVTEVDSQAGGNQTIVITGSDFNSGAIVTFVGANGTNFNASTVTVDSATQITAVASKASFLNAQEPYGVKVQNSNGLAATLASQINVDSSPSWQTASGLLGSVNDTARSTTTFTVSATDFDGDTVSYSLQSGSLPPGGSLNSSTGVISGTFTGVVSDTTSTFTLRATANGKTSDRQFSIVIKALQDTSQTFDFVSASPQTFDVSSINSVNIVMWGAGGNNSSYGGGGGFGSGTLDTSSLSTLYLVVGQTNPSSQGGGGLTGIFSSSTLSQANALAICGGGGASAESGSNGGGGGGFNQNGKNGTVGRQGSGGGGGTLSSGGSGGPNTGGSSGGDSGSALQGGDSPNNVSTRAYLGGGKSKTSPEGIPGGSGGSGYFGGGGGSDYYSTGGGGGSGYADTSLVSNISATQGNTSAGSTAAGSSNQYWSSPIAEAGGNGRIVIEYQI